MQLIAEREMSPGDRMPTEMELAARLGASRTVVREAVKILSATGRVSARRAAACTSPTARGCWARPGSADSSFRRTWTTSSCCSSSAGSRRSRPAVSPPPRPARPNCASSKPPCRPAGTVYQTGDKAQFEAGDDAFHLGVAAASHNFFLVAAVREARRLQRQASVIGIRGMGGHAAEAVEEHDAIYRAIRDGQPDAAADATVVHLDNTLKDYRREIQRRVFGENLP